MYTGEVLKEVARVLLDTQSDEIPKRAFGVHQPIITQQEREFKLSCASFWSLLVVVSVKLVISLMLRQEAIA